MTPLPVRVRFWKKKLAPPPASFPVSKTLARRVFYAASFFYVSFLAHGWLVYAQPSAVPAQPAPVAKAEKPLARDVCEPLLDRLLRVDRRSM